MWHNILSHCEVLNISEHWLILWKYFKSKRKIITFYTTLTDNSTKYLVMCKVYTDVGGIK